MRTIKFRAWNGRERKMTTPALWINELNLPCSQLGSAPTDPLMQFTGLKDKNGVEIYEGDIVRVLYTDWPSQSAETNGRYAMSLDDYKKSISNIGKVVFEDSQFCVQFNTDGYTDSIHTGPHGEIEVIGNIHANPELLDAKL